MEKIDLIAHRDKKSPITEAYRAVRTNLLFGSAGKPLKIIGVTSSTPGEGKSTTSSNLAIVMAQAGKRVLIIDCDLRKPSLQVKFGLPNKGLTNYISLGESLDNVLNKEVCPNLDVLLSGPIPPNPSELLTSEAMQKLVNQVKADYDYIFLDFPPILAVTDAAALAQWVDAFVFVVASNHLSKDELLEAKKRLVQNGAPILGVVMNKVAQDKHSGSYYYYYSNEKISSND